MSLPLTLPTTSKLPTIPPVSHRTLQLDVLLMVLSTHCNRHSLCVWDSLCVSATSMRPVCDLPDSPDPFPPPGGTPFLDPTHLGAFGASTLVPSMGNCHHRCPQILEMPLLRSHKCSPRPVCSLQLLSCTMHNYFILHWRLTTSNTVWYPSCLFLWLKSDEKII